MNLKQFEYVLTIAKAGSISKAADELNISQPSLSQYVKKIETELDVELFDRTNGNCRLTDAGRIFIDTARKAVDLERQMHSALIDLKENKTGSITIGTTPFRSVTMMPAIVAEFKKKYPGVHLIVDEHETHELKDAAERGEFDLSIVNLPVDKKVFKSHLIMEEELVIAVPKGSEFDKKLRENATEQEDRRYPVVDPKLLDGQAFVMVTDTQIMQTALNKLCKEYRLSLDKAVVVKSLEAQIEMVIKGVGSALVPTGLIKFRGDEREISYYSLLKELPKRKVAAIYRKEKNLPKIIADLIDVIIEIEW